MDGVERVVSAPALDVPRAKATQEDTANATQSVLLLSAGVRLRAL
jgi:hypothetical protein